MTKTNSKNSKFYIIICAFLALYLMLPAQQTRAQETTLATTTNPAQLLGDGVDIQQEGSISQYNTPSHSRYGSYQRALIQNIVTESINTTDGTKQQIRYKVEILNGEYKKQTFSITKTADQSTEFNPSIGDKVIVFVQDQGDSSQPNIYLESYDRTNIYLLGLILLVLLIIIFSGAKSFRIILAIILSLLAVTQLAIPLYLKGWPILLTCSIAFLPLGILLVYLKLGWNKQAHTAIVGYSISLMLNCIFLAIIIPWSKLSLPASNPALSFFNNNPQLSPAHIILIGALAGLFAFLQYFSSIIASNIAIAQNNQPKAELKELFTHGMYVGQEILQTNIIIFPLIWIGASITIFIIRYQTQTPWIHLINQEVFVNALIPPLFITIGLILSIPIIVLSCALAWIRIYKKADPLRDAVSWRE